MNFDKALEILELQKKFTKRELKKAYYKKAIRYHPDKNNGDKKKEAIFKQINEAYIFLGDEKNKNIDDLDTSFSNILKRFFDFMVPEMNVDKKDIDNTMKAVIKKCKKTSIGLFEKLSKERAIEIYAFLSKNKDVFSLEPDILKNMTEIIQNKIKNDNIIILNPDITDLLNDKIFKLNYNNSIFYVPLWIDELVFEDVSGNDITIKCIAELPENLHIDDNNILHVNIKKDIKNLLDEKELEVNVGEKTFKINTTKIKITKYQMLKIEKSGILKENIDNIFDDSIRQNIYVHLTLD
jgi:curved DNA-binding protein CbpA